MIRRRSGTAVGRDWQQKTIIRRLKENSRFANFYSPVSPLTGDSDSLSPPVRIMKRLGYDAAKSLLRQLLVENV